MTWTRGLPVTLAAAMAVLVPLSLGAQARSQPLPTFDVISIRPFQRTRQPIDRAPRYDPQRFSIEGAFAQELIEEAYQVTSNQVTGIPLAMRRLRFTVTGTTDKPATKAEMQIMLQRMLAERFHLVVDDETRVQPVYDLVIAKGGPKLLPIQTEKECAAFNAEPEEDLHIPPSSFFSYAGCTITDLVLRLNLPDPTLFELDPLLPVLDKTGLTGLYRIVLWQAHGPRGPVPGHPLVSRPSFIQPIQDALKQELGLELVKAKGPYRVLVIKQMSDPTAN